MLLVAHGPSSVPADSDFAKELRNLVHMTRPKRILETGTLHALGTTRIIGEALKEHGVNADFRSIEVNAANAEEARKNIERFQIPVTLEVGLSIPRALLPNAGQLARDLAGFPDGVYADHEEAERVAKYMAETETGGAEDLIGKVLADWDGMADLIVLDSAGHIGHWEFVHAISHLRGPCWILLDDCNHVKHYRSRDAILGAPRNFRVAADSSERFGFIVAHYTP